MPPFISGTVSLQVGDDMTLATTVFTTFDSPLGELLLIGDGRSLNGLYMQAQKYAREVQSDWRSDAKPFREAIEQLDTYFAGELRTIVPCHRVIGANGSLTGYGGGIERKRWLLAHEARSSYGLSSDAATS
jgi:O6-methylguanine-DNA--protein-cysteine methyltransferase